MKTVSAALDAHLAGEVTTLARCWRITRTDAVEFFFTDHDTDLLFEGNTYKAAVGFEPSAVSNNAGMNVDNLEVVGILDDSSIKADDIRARLFDHAEVRIFIVNWSDLTQGALKLRRGWLGEVTSTPRGAFRAELRGMNQALAQRIGELYSPECRADLGDTRCTVNLATFTRTATIATVIDRRVFTVSGLVDADDFFNAGLLTFTSGPNNGRRIEVKDWTLSTQRFELYLPAGYLPQVGDTISTYAGCDKRHATCKAKFDNLVNFRGEPFLPGLDALLLYPDAR